jgi:purine-binding chemotaxis protein CheW
MGLAGEHPERSCAGADMKAHNPSATPKTDGSKMPLLVFSLEGKLYALGLESVQRVIRSVSITPLPAMPAIMLGIIDLGGAVVPVMDIRGRFKHPTRAIRLSDRFIIAMSGKRRVALPVDATKGTIEASRENFAAADEILPGLGLVEGAMKTDDGLILIHDLARLLSHEEEEAVDRALGAAQAENGARPK